MNAMLYCQHQLYIHITMRDKIIILRCTYDVPTSHKIKTILNEMIEHQFLNAGHIHMECDSNDSKIELLRYHNQQK